MKPRRDAKAPKKFKHLDSKLKKQQLMEER
jgi:hypothetical protein